MHKLKKCFLCGVIDQENDKSLFVVPSGKLAEWQKQIVKPGLTKSSKLCEAHFDKSEIHKGSQIGNEFVPAPRNRLLTKQVVPTKNLEGIATFKRTRNALKPRILNVSSTAGVPRLHTQPCTEIQKPQQWPPELVDAITSSVLPNPTVTADSPTTSDGCNMDAVIPNYALLPPNVDVVANEQESESVCDTMLNEEGLSLISTNGCHAEAVIPAVAAEPKVASNEGVETSTSKAGCCGVTARASKVHRSAMNTNSNCKGCKKYLSMTSRKRNVFRKILPDAYIRCSKNCGMVAKLREIIKEKDKTIRRLRQQNARLHSYLNDMSGKIEQFKVELHNLTEKSLEKQICNLKPQEQEVIKTFIAKGRSELTSESGKSYSMRYGPGFLLQCLLLKMKSTSAYNHLRNRSILPLPHPDTVRKLLSSTPCKFGYNDIALESIKREFHRQQLSEKSRMRWGTLIWDEVKLKKDLSFDKHLLEWKGLVDFGDGIQSPIPEGLADHALVFIFRGHNFRWIQPIACFASQGATSGKVLHEIITQAMITLHNHGAIVKATVSDGHVCNKQAMEMFGIDVKKKLDGTCKSSFVHPMDDSINVYHFVDAPHLLKCARNYILTHRKVQFASSTVEYVFFERLHRLEQHWHFRKAHKLTPSHIHPNNFERMNVSKAAQLLSDSVAMALSFYRENDQSGRYKKLFLGSSPTERVTKLLNDIFDIFNSRRAATAVTKSNWTASVMFMSETTVQGWRLSVNSLISLIEEMLDASDTSLYDNPYQQILTAKFNQDPVERFFGIVRAIDGHPTCTSWLHLFRILSLYNSSTMDVNGGNVDNEEKYYLLIEYKDCLLKRFKEDTAASRNIRESLKDSLLEELSLRFVEDIEDERRRT